MSDEVKEPPHDTRLGQSERDEIDAFHWRSRTGTHYEVLGVASDADRRAIRDAYFSLSKRFHPDVFYGREIVEIFRALTTAYDVRSNPKLRQDYDRRHGLPGVAAAVEAKPVAPPQRSPASSEPVSGSPSPRSPTASKPLSSHSPAANAAPAQPQPATPPPSSPPPAFRKPSEVDFTVAPAFVAGPPVGTGAPQPQPTQPTATSCRH